MCSDQTRQLNYSDKKPCEGFSFTSVLLSSLEIPQATSQLVEPVFKSGKHHIQNVVIGVLVLRNDAPQIVSNL